MNLQNLKQLFADNGCQKIYVKVLVPNNNSKNQVYFGGNFEVLNILPITEIKSEPSSDAEKERFKAAINFAWINEDGNIYSAPKAQLILYPQYPEVRFSGFLSGCQNPPSYLMTQKTAGRLLFLGVISQGLILGHVTAPDSEITQEFNQLKNVEEQGVFKILELLQTVNNKSKLLKELHRIYLLDWVLSKRLNKNGEVLPCNSSNCGGYTLEAELGITPNGYSEPDYLGWEVKQFGVQKLESVSTSAPITLMTPEPTHGYYVTAGIEAFIRRYGYQDAKGRVDRMNFNGVHKIGKVYPRTGLRLELVGFDIEAGKIRNTEGKIVLIDSNDNDAASWSFSSLLLHWNRKHNQACYVPSKSDKIGEQKYKFGNRITLGIGTDFQLFLAQMALGNIYYDPGVKVEDISTKPKVKRRSQFRIKSKHLSNIYKTSEIVTL